MKETVESWYSITLVYVGKRITTKNKLAHCYEDASNEQRLFKKPLKESQIVGEVMQCTTDGKAYRFENYLNRADIESVKEWSIKERAAIEEFNERKRRAIKPNTHVDTLIKSVKETCKDYSSRKRLGLYILTELLK